MALARIVCAIAAVPVVLFCAFGFMASFEGSDAKYWAFRIGYAVIGLSAIGVAFACLRKRP